MSAEMPFKFMSDTRRQVGNFEMIDLIDEDRIDSMRETLHVDAPSHIQWNHWEYGSEVEELRNLYEKGKSNQWNSSTDLDWDMPVSKDEWFGNMEMSLMANLLKMMGKSEAEQKAAMFDEVAYVCSQLLHGEQAALQLCGQLTALCPTTDEKLYAANQVADEARHVEIFSRFVGEKMGTIYPITPVLKVLLDELLTVEGYQTFEGLYEVDGDVLAQLSTRGAVRPDEAGAPEIWINGESWWDPARGRMTSRELRVVLANAEGPGELTLRAREIR